MLPGNPPPVRTSISKPIVWAAWRFPTTQRAVDLFPISHCSLPTEIIHALGLIKGAAAIANRQLGLLPAAIGHAIIRAADEVAERQHDVQFVVDVFQTGSGTSSNMNANEVFDSANSGGNLETEESRCIRRKIVIASYFNLKPKTRLFTQAQSRDIIRLRWNGCLAARALKD
jgi:Lyase